MLFGGTVLRPILARLSNLTVDGGFVEVRNGIGTGVVVGRRLRDFAFSTFTPMFVGEFDFRITFKARAVAVGSSAHARLLRGFEDRLFVGFYEGMTRNVLRDDDYLHQDGHVAAVQYPPCAFCGV